MGLQIIKRIISQENFPDYNIPDSFGDKAEVIIIPYIEGEIDMENNESFYLMKAQERNGSANMLNEPEEEAWNEV